MKKNNTQKKTRKPEKKRPTAKQELSIKDLKEITGGMRKDSCTADGGTGCTQ
jgi:bacteriocin-like protein